jgi:hypothetical protein
VFWGAIGGFGLGAVTGYLYKALEDYDNEPEEGDTESK